MSLMQLQLSFAWIMTMMMMWTRVTRDIVEAQRKKLGRGTMFDLVNLFHIVNIFWHSFLRLKNFFFNSWQICSPIMWWFFKVFVVPSAFSTLKKHKKKIFFFVFGVFKISPSKIPHLLYSQNWCCSHVQYINVVFFKELMCNIFSIHLKKYQNCNWRKKIQWQTVINRYSWK